MKQRTFMIFLSCAIGSGMGFLLAQSFGMFWMLGILLGGFTGYLVYDFKQVLSAIPEALEYASDTVGNWEIKKNIWKAIRYTFYGFWVLFVPLTVLFIYVDQIPNPGFVVLFTFYCFIAMLLALFIILVKHQTEEQEYDMDPRFKQLLERTKIWPLLRKATANNFIFIMSLCFSFLIAIYPFLILILVLGVIILKNIGGWIISLAKFLFAFFWKYFKMVHSDVRLIAGVDAMIGGFIGYYFLPDIYLWGYNITILACMLISGSLGVLNYRLVSIRLLKLEPKT